MRASLTGSELERASCSEHTDMFVIEADLMTLLWTWREGREDMEIVSDCSEDWELWLCLHSPVCTTCNVLLVLGVTL